jgi:hypothetical protein
MWPFLYSGSPTWTRTRDLRINSQIDALKKRFAKDQYSYLAFLEYRDLISQEGEDAMKIRIFLSATGLSLLLAVWISAPAQVPAASPSPPQAPATPSSTAPTGKTFSEQEIEQLVAPIALHPDALFTQILMASTYPLEVVAADRWVKSNSELKGKALEDALQGQTWDPSVKSLTVFPQVLTMMSEKIDWTQKLGDAFLAQQKDVLAAAQTLRNKAAAEGTLKDTEQQKVVTEQVESKTIIKIEPTNPEVVYVPTYNPTVVYGSWPYPSYPPYSYYPPGYTAGAALFTFAAGAAVGAALWGNSNWGRGDVDVNVNRYNSFNRSNTTNRTWSHNAAHRGAVPYRDRGVAQQYGRTRTTADAASREQFRGRAEAGRGAIQRGEVSSANLGNRGGSRSGTTAAGREVGNRNAGAGGRNASVSDRNAGAGGRNAGVSDRSAGDRSAGAGGRSAGAGDRSGGARDTGMRSASAFDPGRGTQARDASSRGGSSLSAARSSGNLGGGAGAGAGGGARGGARGGGGRGGGGGGGRGGRG